MGKLLDLEFSDSRHTLVTAELLEEAAPIACENLWTAIAESYRARLHHGRHCAAELWCYLPHPNEEIPYENSTVFPEIGDILYYHFIQPPTRQGRWVFDLGIFYSHGQSRLPSGWLPGNRVARLRGGDEAIRHLELIAADLLQGREIEVVLRRRAGVPESAVTPTAQAAALASWLARLDEAPETATEADVTRWCAGAERFAQGLVEWLEHAGPSLAPADREELRAGARRAMHLAAWWRFATDSPPPPGWQAPAAAYWRAVARHHVDGAPFP